MTNSTRKLRNNLTGNVYGRLTVIGVSDNRMHDRVAYTVKCECGTVKDIVGYTLTRKTKPVTSCGCNKGGVALPGNEAAYRKLSYEIRAAARNRGYEYTLTDEETRTITKENCAYCGCEPAQIKKGYKDAEVYVYNGIDRVDNSRGYVSDNVVACCGKCNRIKMDHDLEDLKAHLRKMLAHMEG